MTSRSLVISRWVAFAAAVGLAAAAAHARSDEIHMMARSVGGTPAQQELTATVAVHMAAIANVLSVMGVTLLVVVGLWLITRARRRPVSASARHTVHLGLSLFMACYAGVTVVGALA